jgi:uncharacterized membrane protein required for colicin V production
MTIYDAAMVGLVVSGMIWGAIRGITWQLASMASLVLGYLVAFPLSGQLVSHFPGEPVVARSLALLASYAAVSGSVFLAAWMVRATLRRWQFEAYDHHLGMILGSLEGAIVGLVITLFVVSLSPQWRTPILTSPSGRVVCRVLNTIEPVLPGEIRTELSPFWNSMSMDAISSQTPQQPNPEVETTDPGRTQANMKDQASTVLQNLLQEGESRVGRAITEAADKQLSGTTQGHDRKVERR